MRERWISVEDRLPDSEKGVLACYKFRGYQHGLRFVDVLSYLGHSPTPHWQYEERGVQVTHWMPLPALPAIKGDTTERMGEHDA